ncbi:u3 small nucleolar ribonucleoprotein MPP10 [Cichlidogyrus casuarinus]|uniref:U3 small nucleolar ribonucleoprotein MPP10 n=1 Tax=Cichlidogyrus casuarinus TaxID=1844966 RepID=A0ABD2Q3L6_9PLAT
MSKTQSKSEHIRPSFNKLNKNTEKLEKKLLEPKSWVFKGEASAKDREENALLAEDLDIQRHGVQKPLPADEDVIEEFIKKCILERRFDSPVFKAPELKKSTNKIVELDTGTQKSLVEDYESLAYRSKMLEQKQKDPEKEALRVEIINLFATLDALSNQHYIPRRHVPGLRLLENKAAVAMEEAGPSAMTSEDVLAPEEVMAPRGELPIGKSEVTKTDRRRHRKKLMRVRSKQREIRAKKAKTDQSKSVQLAMDKVVKMSHKPGSKVKIYK